MNSLYVVVLFALVALAAAAPAPKPVTAGQDTKCVVCEFLVNQAEALISKNTTEAEIEASLEQFCARFPRIKDACDNLVEQYLPSIIEYLVGNVPAETVCAKIALCPPTFHINGFNPAEIRCSACKVFSGFLIKYIDQEDIPDKTAAALEKICQGLNNNFLKEACEDLEKKVPEALQDIIEKETPETLCQQIKFCPTA